MREVRKEENFHRTVVWEKFLSAVNTVGWKRGSWIRCTRDPRAYQGWQSMTPLQRGYHLLDIFYCRTPETRERHIAKMLEDSLARLEHKPRSKAAPEEPAHEELW